MLDISTILQYKDDPQTSAGGLSREDIAFLVVLLDGKNTVRHAASLLLQYRSRIRSDVYDHWDTFCRHLESKNAFRRDSALLLLSENVRWDTERRFDRVVEECLQCCMDEKFIVCRCAVRCIGIWAPFRPSLAESTMEWLTHVNPKEFRHPNLILADILEVMIPWQKRSGNKTAADYINSMLTGGMLDEKNARALERIWRSESVVEQH